jgi:hypothetical protein
MMNPLIVNCTDCGREADKGEFMFPMFQILPDGSATPATLCKWCIRKMLARSLT